MNVFQEKCDRFSKHCAVLLGFVIPVSTAATNIVLPVFVLSWFLAGNLHTKTKIMMQHPIARSAALLLGLFVVGSLYSPAPPAEIIHTFSKFSKLLYLLFLLPLMTEPLWRKKGIAVFVGAMLLTLFVGFLKKYAGFSISADVADAIFKNHIDTSLMMAFSSFIIGHYACNARQVMVRCLWLLCLIGFIFYLFFINQGRAGQIIVCVLLVLLSIQRFSFKGILFSVIGIVVILGLSHQKSVSFQQTLTATHQDIVKHQSGNNVTSVGQRLEYTQETWRLSQRRLWCGFGTGSFKTIYEAHARLNQLQLTDNPHNEYLNIFFQLGILGIIVFLGLLWKILKYSFGLSSEDGRVAQGLVIAMALGCIANSWLMDFTSGYFFVVLTAYSCGGYPRKQELNCG